MVALFVAAMVVGALLVVLGLRGRVVDDHPLCRGCGFDLVATVGRAGKCPECGAEVADARAIRIGHRRKRRGPLVAGAVLLLLCGVAVSVVLAGSRLKINSYLPTSVLMLESRGGGSASAGAAVAELDARMGKGTLRDADARVLVERGLRLQGDTAAPWAQEWGDFLEAAWAKGLLTEEQRAAYTKNAVKFRFVMRDPAREGQKCGVSLEVSLARTGNKLPLYITPTLKSMSIGGKPAEGDFGGMSSTIGMSGSGGTGTVSEEIDLNVAPGDYDIESAWHVSVSTPSKPEPIVEWETAQNGRLKVLARDAELVKRIKDESIREAMEKAVSITRASLSGSGEKRRFNAAIQIKNPPAPMAFSVFVRDGAGREWKVGVVTVPAAKQSTHSTSFAGDTPGLGGGEVDVVLRPSLDAAMRTVFLKEMWDGEIVIKGVAVKVPAGE